MYIFEEIIVSLKCNIKYKVDHECDTRNEINIKWHDKEIFKKKPTNGK